MGHDVSDMPGEVITARPTGTGCVRSAQLEEDTYVTSVDARCLRDAAQRRHQNRSDLVWCLRQGTALRHPGSGAIEEEREGLNHKQFSKRTRLKMS